MESSKNIFGVIVLTIIILIFSVGGYFAMNYFTKESVNNTSSVKQEEQDIRIDKTKDYIYFTDTEEIVGSEEIIKENAVFNFSSLSALNDTLKSEVNSIYSDIKYTKDMELPTENSEGEEITYYENTEGIYSLSYRDYTSFKFGNYVSLLVEDYDYDIVDGAHPTDIKGYVVNLSNGKLYTDDEVLTLFNTNWDNLREQVRARLNDTQTLVGEEAVIDIEGTMNSLDTYALYVNKVGKLSLSFIVKSNQNNYNDSITVD